MFFLKNFFLFFFIFGIFNISYFFCKFSKQKLTLENLSFYFLLLISIISVAFFYLLLFKYLNFSLIKYFNYFVALLPFALYRSSFILANSFLYKFRDGEKILFFYFLFSLFLLSILPVSDPDSLDYHLGIPKQWIIDEGFAQNSNWLHYQLSSYGESINLISIISFDGKLMSFLKVVLLMLLILLLDKKKIIKNYLLNIFLASPIFIFFVFSQKPQFFGFLILSIVFFIFIKNIRKMSDYTGFFIIFLLSYVSTLNYSFLPITVSFMIFFIFFHKDNFVKNKYLIMYSLFIIIIIVGPIYVKNILYHGNFLAPFFEKYISADPKDYNVNFANYLRTFGDSMNWNNFILFPIKFFIPFNLSDSINIYGPLFIFLFFIKKFTKKSKYFFFLLVISVLCIMSTTQISNRYYFISYLFLLYFLSTCIFTKKIYLHKISKIILFSFSSILLLYTMLNINSLFSKNHEENFLKKNAYQYEEIQWINSKINDNIIFTSDIRSKSLLGSNHFTPHYLFYVDQKNFNKEFFNFVVKNNIVLFTFVLNEKSNLLNDHLIKCKKVLFSKDFFYKQRNFLLKDKKITREIFQLDLNQINCRLN